MTDRAARLHSVILRIAIHPPVKAGHAGNAYVPWALIEELRGELASLGIDWRGLKRSAYTLSATQDGGGR